jgi:dTDP-4-dehydrorhamnose reductase
MLAEAMAQILNLILRGDLSAERVKGIYHATNGGQTRWFGVARANLKSGRRRCRLLPIPTSAYPTVACLRAYSVLDDSKLLQTFALALPDWDQSCGSASRT